MLQQPQYLREKTHARWRLVALTLGFILVHVFRHIAPALSTTFLCVCSLGLLIELVLWVDELHVSQQILTFLLGLVPYLYARFRGARNDGQQAAGGAPRDGPGGPRGGPGGPRGGPAVLVQNVHVLEDFGRVRRRPARRGRSIEPR